MCMAPKMPAPKPVAPRQAAQAPRAAAISSSVQDQLARRSSMASTVMTPLMGLGAAPTAGKALLGS